MTGYRHPAYAASLAEVGTPLELLTCGAWLLMRSIPGTTAVDAMGCYPLFACRDWSGLGADIESLEGRAVSVSLIADPFGDYGPADLRSVFPDVCRPFKEHFVIDLKAEPGPDLPVNHQRNLLRAEQAVTVEHCAEPERWSSEWQALYQGLTERHHIRGLAALGSASLARQLRVPGLTMFRAVHQDTTVGIMLWFTHNSVAYYHLAAYSDAGYTLRASFAVMQHAIEYFRGRVRWINLGAGPSSRNSTDDGLTRFKRGWASGTRTAWLCGRVLDRQRYAALTSAAAPGSPDYFPAYRNGEFA